MPISARRWTALPRLLVAALLVALPAAVHAASGVTFLDNRDLTLRIAADETRTSLSAYITVLNGSAAPQTVTLEFNGLLSDQGAPFSLSLAPSLPLSLSLGADTVGTFPLTLSTDTIVRPVAPRFSGQLIVHSSDGTSDRRAVVLLVAARPTGAGQEASSGLDPAYVTSINLAGVNNFPSLLSPWIDWIQTPTLTVTARYAANNALVGELAGDTGALAQVSLDRRNLVITNITSAGTYKGQIDLQPGASSGKVAVTLTVRDHWGYAVLGLLAGLLLTFFLQWLISSSLPRQRLVLKLGHVIEHVGREQDAARARAALIPAETGLSRDVITIYQIEKKPEGAQQLETGLLAFVSQDMLQGFDGQPIWSDQPNDPAGDAPRQRPPVINWQGRAPTWWKSWLLGTASPDDRKRWGPDGPELKLVEGYVTTLSDIHALAFAMVASYVQVQVIDDRLKALNLSSAKTTALQQASKALAPGRIDTPAQLAERQSALKNAAVFLTAFHDTAVELFTLYSDTPDLSPDPSPERAAVAVLLAELYGDRVPNPDIVAIIQADGRRLRLQFELARQLRPLRIIEEQTAGAEAPSAAAAPPILSFHELSAILNRLAAPRPAAPKTSKQLQAEYRRANFNYKLLIIVLVLLTGLYTFYLPNQTFGSLKDYLALLLWGSTLSGGLELLRRYWPDLMSNSGG